MTDIDLTAVVTAAAKRLHAEHRKQAEHVSPEPLPDWPAFEDSALSEQNYWREVVLPIVWAAHRDIARQAFDHALAEAGVCGWVPTPGSRTVANPYQDAA